MEICFDCLMRASWILTFWSSNSWVPLLGLYLLFVLKLRTPFLSYVVLLWSMHGCTPHLFLSILMGPSLVRMWGCAAVFPDYDVFIYLPVVASIFTAELSAIFLALSRISFHDRNNLVIYSDHDTSPFPFNFVSVKARNSSFPFLKMSIAFSLFVVSLIPLTFHVTKRLT